MRHPLARSLALGAVFALLLAAFLAVVRPTYLNWGATAEERRRILPGDDIVPQAASQSTRAIAIRAPVEDVWHWVAQTGQDRGGFYSFDLLENLVGCEMPTVDVLRAHLQEWKIGDKLWMYPPSKAGGAGFATLRTYIPDRALGFATRIVGTSLDEAEDGSWTFVVEPIDRGTTRLIIRGRGRARVSLLGTAFDRGVFEPVHFAMERRMMIGLRELAETGMRSRRLNHFHVLLWALTLGLFLHAAVLVISRHAWKRPLLGFAAAGVVFQILTLAQPPLVIGVGLVVLLVALVRQPAMSGRARHVHASAADATRAVS